MDNDRVDRLIEKVEELTEKIERIIDPEKGIYPQIQAVRGQVKIQWWFIGGIVLLLLGFTVQSLF